MISASTIGTSTPFKAVQILEKPGGIFKQLRRMAIETYAARTEISWCEATYMRAKCTREVRPAEYPVAFWGRFQETKPASVSAAKLHA